MATITPIGSQNPIQVSFGGTGDATLTAYAVLCGGTTATNPVQSIAGVGTSGQILTSNGAGMLPTFQNAPASGISTLTGDVGGAVTPTAGNINIESSLASNNAGGTVFFEGSSPDLVLNTSDTVLENTFVGNNAGNTSTTGTGGNTAFGMNALSAVDTGAVNTGIGRGALQALNTGGSNTAVGNLSGSNVTDSEFNTFVGDGSGTGIVSGGANTAIGYNSLISGDSQFSTFVGFGAGSNAGASTGNTGIGGQVLGTINGGSQNTAVGNSAMFNNNGGNDNVAIGKQALSENTGGSGNISIGTDSSFNLNGNESNNIMIGNQGVTGDGGIIRIGTSGTHGKNFQAGIVGVTTDVNDAIPVLIDSAGQLGTVSSSERYKENIWDLHESKVLELRPVQFNYKKNGCKAIGLIAEEVAEVIPDLVVSNKQGLPETIKYQDIPILLLVELKRLHKRIEYLESKLN